MRRLTSVKGRAALSATALALLLGSAAGGAFAQEESPAPEPVTTTEEAVTTEGTNTAPTAPLPLKDNTFLLGQSMQIRVNADAEPNSSLANFRWTVSQLGVQGPADGSKDGTYDIPVPEGGTMARYLTQFGRPPIDNGVAQFSVDVENGAGVQRTVSLFPQDGVPPVALEAKFTLNGEPITAKDLVGKDGVVTAQYTLSNKTAQPTEVTVNDLAGNPVTKTVDADVPMIGIAKTLLPQRYIGLNTGMGQFGADGRGNNQVQWIALPFKPLSKDGTATFGWSANVTDAVIPSILLQVAPIYLGAHADDPSTPNVDESQVNAPPVNLDPAVAEIQAGLASVIAGVETLTAGGGTDPLQTVEDRLNTFFATFGTDLQTVVETLQPTIDLLNQVNPILAQASTAVNTLNENWDQIGQVVGFIAGSNATVLCTSLNAGGAPIPPQLDANGDGRWNTPECATLIGVAQEAQGNLDRWGGQISVVAPLLSQLVPLTQGLQTALSGIQEKLVAISTGLQNSGVDLPTIDAVISSAVASVLASPGGQQITGGLSQVSGGVGMAKAEISTFLAQAIVQIRGVVGTADEAVVELKASIAGLKSAASRSPLIYGPLPEGTPPNTVLAGAYEFRIDAADTNLPYTPWRILVGVLFVVAAVVVGMWAQKRRSAAEPPTQAPA